MRSLIEEWNRCASIGPLTWRDEAATWPQPITPDRSSVHVPESLGLKVRKRTLDDEFEVVVWTGGWADVGYLLGGKVHTFCPQFRNVDDDAYAPWSRGSRTSSLRTCGARRRSWTGLLRLGR